MVSSAVCHTHLRLLRSPAASRGGVRNSRRTLRLAVSNKLVLVPTGDGSCNHLETPVDRPSVIELRSGLLELGREGPADIVIPVPTVSTRHSMVRVEGNKVTVTDLNSTNGTYINDEELIPMKATELPIGAEVTFGDMFLARFALAEQADAEPVTVDVTPE